MDAVAAIEKTEGKDPLAEWRVERDNMLKERDMVGSILLAYFPGSLYTKFPTGCPADHKFL